MIKQQKQTALGKIVSSSGILKAISEMERELNAYGLSEIIVENRYEVRMKVENLMKTMETLSLQLIDMTDKSVNWEALE